MFCVCFCVFLRVFCVLVSPSSRCLPHLSGPFSCSFRVQLRLENSVFFFVATLCVEALVFRSNQKSMSCTICDKPTNSGTHVFFQCFCVWFFFGFRGVFNRSCSVGDSVVVKGKPFHNSCYTAAFGKAPAVGMLLCYLFPSFPSSSSSFSRTTPLSSPNHLHNVFHSPRGGLYTLFAFFFSFPFRFCDLIP